MTRILLAVLPAALALSGCIKFGAEPPPSLLTITPATSLAVGQTVSGGNPITIAVPMVPQEVATTRVPVRSSDTTIAYLKDAVWVEPPNRLFARLLSDTIATRTGRMVLSRRQAIGEQPTVLSGELRQFGVDAATSEVVVTFDASLARKGPDSVEKRRFETRVATSAIEPGAVGIALNQAANTLAGEVADWVGR